MPRDFIPVKQHPKHAPLSAAEDFRRRQSLADVVTQPRSSLIHRGASRVHQQRGDHARMDAHLTRAIELGPNPARAWFELGRKLEQRGALAGAGEAYRRAVAAVDANGEEADALRQLVP